MPRFNVLAFAENCSEEDQHLIIESYVTFFETLTPKHQSKVRLNLVSAVSTLRSKAGIVVPNAEYNIAVLPTDDPQKINHLTREAHILLLPNMDEPATYHTDLLIAGVPILCHKRSKIKKLAPKSYTILVGTTAKPYNAFIDEFAAGLDMLYWDFQVLKQLKARAMKKFRRKSRALMSG